MADGRHIAFLKNAKSYIYRGISMTFQL